MTNKVHTPAAARRIDELSQLRNIGKAMRADFVLLGVQTVKQLARCDADELYARIQQLTQSRHDPCVWDTYAAAIHQAKTGEALPWWDFTKVRKQRSAKVTPTSPVPSPGSGRGLGRGKSEAAKSTPAVTVKFNRYPAAIKAKLLSLRELILEVAAETDGVGELEETLKWGQISYLTSQTGSGSLIRIDQHGSSTSEYALYFHCQTTLVDTFRERFGKQLKIEGNRAVLLDVRKAAPVKVLRHCIELALTYHLAKKAIKPSGNINLRKRVSHAR
jgi:Pathogenicity locus/Domain of unknown function (DU1801)